MGCGSFVESRMWGERRGGVQTVCQSEFVALNPNCAQVELEFAKAKKKKPSRASGKSKKC